MATNLQTSQALAYVETEQKLLKVPQALVYVEAEQKILKLSHAVVYVEVVENLSNPFGPKIQII